ncbi:MAG TPA: DNA repair protein RecN [Bacteroidales bacterium]|nr:DNA repair protein RecN [Bacteroidales bacterium]
MLRNLHIENYALIDKLDLTFDEGLSVITGETGAGKSILLGALSLILGQRADNRVILENAEKCVTEATFLIKSYGLQSFFEENDLEFDLESCIIRRELFNNGKSRAFVNDSPVSLNILKELSSRLIDIHSQHQNLLLGNDAYQREIVDAVAGNNLLVSNYREAFGCYKELQTNLKKLEDKALKAREEEDYLRFQLEQLEGAGLEIGEQEALEAEWEMLTHAEEIKMGLAKIFSLLDEEEHGINTSLKTALNQSDHLLKVFPKLQEAGERIRTSYLDLKDLSRELEVLLHDVDVNPTRMDQISQRLNLLFTLQQKHHSKNSTELIALRDEFAGKLNFIESFDTNIEDLKKELAASEVVVKELAAELTKKRRSVLQTIEKHLIGQLVQLGIPKAVLKIECEPKALDSDGQDSISFLFTANAQTQPQAIERIASGGEISRIMLCIKSLIAEFSNLPTLLFDEIDTGVSGEIAYKMGEIMKGIAENRQVLCITHLPQIAVKGKNHFKVLKTELNGKTFTKVNALNPDERLTEIALMLSGANLTDAAIRNARQLMLENSI